MFTITGNKSVGCFQKLRRSLFDHGKTIPIDRKFCVENKNKPGRQWANLFAKIIVKMILFYKLVETSLWIKVNVEGSCIYNILKSDLNTP